MPTPPSGGSGIAAARHDFAPARVLIIACGALAREISWLIRQNRLTNVTLTCLPATLHNRPDQIPEAVRRAIAKARATYDRILIGYGDCGTGGLLDRVIAEEGVQRIEGAHCYAFLSGTEAFMARADGEDMRAFYLTDFLARQFDALVWRPLGLDRHPELRETYFGAYEKVVHLTQTGDPMLGEKARRAAKRLGLAFESRFTGYGLLQPFVIEAGLSQLSLDTVPA